MKALIVDDALFMRHILKHYLSELGFSEILEAGDGRTAVDLFKKHQPDLVTMDLTMPEMDGLASIKRIMEYDGNARIIVCSALGSREFVIEAMKLGAKNYITKPFREQQIAQTVKSVMGL